ncbi:hypothetical protein M153_1590004124 [Pseudoloma neurophilia]|uniref:Uncharacterized protein n=1 Tax=Pseudoloma neurophilia TaxID=146866 RepID=A0A0R0LZG9_9MICR|nr:hypothetical protein M153_1590004124 [Pseudoloma neurophilia]
MIKNQTSITTKFKKIQVNSTNIYNLIYFCCENCFFFKKFERLN